MLTAVIFIAPHVHRYVASVMLRMFCFGRSRSVAGAKQRFTTRRHDYLPSVAPAPAVTYTLVDFVDRAGAGELVVEREAQRRELRLGVFEPLNDHHQVRAVKEKGCAHVHELFALLG